MFRLVQMIRRRPELSNREFCDEWRDGHGPFVAARAARVGIRRYVQTHILFDDPFGNLLQSTYGTAPDLYDGVAELWFEDREGLLARLRTAEGRQALTELLDDAARIVDVARSPLWFAFEAPQIGPAGYSVAREHSSVVKWIALLSKAEHLTWPQVRTHWLINHGPLVREQACVVPIQRYLQLHRFDDALALELGLAREGSTPPFFGHAELWLDRLALNAMSGPEVERAFGLLLEDCKLFIDLPKSYFMVGKEHVFVDAPLVVRPLPRPGPEVF